MPNRSNATDLYNATKSREPRLVVINFYYLQYHTVFEKS